MNHVHAGLLAALVLSACAEESATQILVVVDSDFPAGALDEVRVRAKLADAAPTAFNAATRSHSGPMTFALFHGGGPLGPLRVEVEGVSGGDVRVQRTAEAAFVAGKIMVLRMDLFAGCADMICNEQSCGAGGCEDATTAGQRLSPWQGDIGSRPLWQGNVGEKDAGSGGRDGRDAMIALLPDARDGGLAVDGPPPDGRVDPPDGDGHSLGTCAMFPGNGVWHVDVRGWPVAAQSSTYLATLGGSGAKVSLGFGPDRGVIWRSVDDRQATSQVELMKPNVKLAWPVPADFALTDSPASRLLLINRSKCLLHEASGCQKLPGGFLCETGGAAALNANWVRQPGTVMAQDSGLALFPALLRVSEVKNDDLTHALGLAAGPLQAGFVAPALNHLGGSATSPTLPPMGVRMRLRANYPEAGLGQAARTIVRALKLHGAVITHRQNGLNLLGERSGEWAELDLSGLFELTAADFEILAHDMITL